jgi:hypothetical protein
MKRLNYDGQSLVTGSAAADAVMEAAKAVVRMSSGASIDIAVREDDGGVVTHTLLLNPSTALESFELEEVAEPDEEELYPVPDAPPIGSKAVSVSPEDAESLAPPTD